eukprot:CAMPEP_0204413312 /NCGR_PEP_ID=MMETSP0470-20130426/18124_1 /ASSEMBLY_ACC=CAM_ASM_000385 /TAXON_ID=2969 /ORGANISM="Oxyrrhis marina" /LENGTH=34 /DNA_ID= /DNA_START= /DNA_END= /DNA_ORIENTATION=
MGCGQYDLAAQSRGLGEVRGKVEHVLFIFCDVRG